MKKYKIHIHLLLSILVCFCLPMHTPQKAKEACICDTNFDEVRWLEFPKQRHYKVSRH